jgi:putative sporulation protein YyaC
MERINERYTDLTLVNKSVEFLTRKFKESGKNEVIVINIGTDKCIGDTLAPLVGTLLEGYDIGFKVYGNLDHPIHALNLDERVSEIKNNHPNAFIIGIDAGLGDRKSIGEIVMKDSPINPGKGVGKTLQEVGDVSIVGIGGDADDGFWIMEKSIRLNLVYKMAKRISEIIVKMDKEIHNDIFSEEIALSI